MSYYGLRPEDWRHKLPPGVAIYDFADGQCMIPMQDVNGSYLTCALVALREDPIPPHGKPFKILGFKIAHGALIRKNSDWGSILDKMIARWNKGVDPVKHGAAIPIAEDDIPSETPSPRPAEPDRPDAT